MLIIQLITQAYNLNFEGKDSTFRTKSNTFFDV